MYTGWCWLIKDSYFRCLASIGLCMLQPKSLFLAQRQVTTEASVLCLHGKLKRWASQSLLHLQWFTMTQILCMFAPQWNDHNTFHSEDITPDLHKNSDQSLVQGRQEYTHTLLKTPHPTPAVSYRVKHITGLEVTIAIRKHNSVQQKVAKLSVDWSRFTFQLTILLSREAGSAGVIWFPAAPR